MTTADPTWLISLRPTTSQLAEISSTYPSTAHALIAQSPLAATPRSHIESTIKLSLRTSTLPGPPKRELTDMTSSTDGSLMRRQTTEEASPPNKPLSTPPTDSQTLPRKSPHSSGASARASPETSGSPSPVSRTATLSPLPQLPDNSSSTLMAPSSTTSTSPSPTTSHPMPASSRSSTLP